MSNYHFPMVWMPKKTHKPIAVFSIFIETNLHLMMEKSPTQPGDLYDIAIENGPAEIVSCPTQNCDCSMFFCMLIG